MSFENYLTTHYSTACSLQRAITEDNGMKAMLRSGRRDLSRVKSWMKNYALFQGIKSDDRHRIAAAFLDVARDFRRREITVEARDALENTYEELLTALYGVVNRSWMSASSKLLWCIYPDTVVIYDSFVERALIVLQCLDAELADFPRIGDAPRVTSRADIADATTYYMNYQDMVKCLLARNSATLRNLRSEYNEEYPHDIRIIDKLLWMIGNPKHPVMV